MKPAMCGNPTGPLVGVRRVGSFYHFNAKQILRVARAEAFANSV